MLILKKRQLKSPAHIMIAEVLVAFVGILVLSLSVSAQQTAVFHVLSDDQPLAFNHCNVIKSCSLAALLSSNILSDNVSNTMVMLHPGSHTINSTLNQVFSINNATNLMLTAANVSEHAIIKCNGKMGFSFKLCNKLSIHGINFESCSGHQITIQSGKAVLNYFALFVHYSFDVNISAVMARNSDGIGLLVINVYGTFTISDSVFSNNAGNVYYFSIDKDDNANLNFTPRDTDININNSRFEFGTTCKYKSPLLGRIYHAGVVLKLAQATFKTRTLLFNITLITNNSYSITVDLNFPTNKLKIENITSMSLNDKLGMLIYFTSSSSLSHYVATDCETTVIINYAQLRKSRLFITTTGNPKSCKLCTNLSNIYIDKAHSGNKYPLLVTGVPCIVVRDIIIQNTTGTVAFFRCNLQLQGQFIYQQNRGSITLSESQVTIHNTVVIIRNNTANHYAPLYIASSQIGIQKSFISVSSNTGTEGGGIALANTTIHFIDDSQAEFSYNTGQRGGAMAFYQSSQLIFDSGATNFTFIRNHAGAKGGTIYVHDEEYVMYDKLVQPHLTKKRYKKFLIIHRFQVEHKQVSIASIIPQPKQEVQSLVGQ